jgi:ComF family protein
MGSMSNSALKFLANCVKSGQRHVTPDCLLCGGASSGAMLCAPCDADLPRIAREHCVVCALPLAGSGGNATCGACLADPPAYDHVCAAFAYAFPADALVQALKYRGQLAIAPLLGEALARVLAIDTRPDVLVAMPLSAGRLRERGFNQAQEIARHVAKTSGIPLQSNACRRVSETPPQAALPYKERAKNVRNAFVCDANFDGKHVAIVDDVMTTGATLNELAKKIKRAGAARVTGLVATRTLPYGDLPARSTHD